MPRIVMPHPSGPRTTLAAMLCAALLASGCISTESAPTRFDLLRDLPADSVALTGATPAKPAAVDIAALRLPQYLERPQIVTRSDTNRLHLADYDQWGGNLAKDMMRVLARNLAVLLATPEVTAFSRRPPASADARVEIEILAFERGPDRRVTLSAQWRLFTGAGAAPMVTRISDLVGPPIADAADMDATVASMSTLLGDLSRLIAAAIVAQSGT